MVSRKLRHKQTTEGNEAVWKEGGGSDGLSSFFLIEHKTQLS